MVIAIVVAVLAVGVIVYGYLRRAKIERLEREYLEQLAPAVPEPVAAGTDGGCGVRSGYDSGIVCLYWL